jgi:predicted AlkP superfamily phosphohydrolase/phosphomutase
MGLLDKFKKNERKRAIVIGLDGVPYTLLKELKEKERISHMSSLFDTGYFGQMNVCIPEISSVSWSSFMTGKQSGEHGIYGFIDLLPNTYNMYFPNYANLKARTLWDELAEMGKNTVVVNMPATYPARELSGAMVSGFVSIDINKAIYPGSLIPRLNDLNYRIDIDTAKARHDHEYLFSELYSILEGRKRAVELLWEEIDWDLFIVVVTGTDRLMHFLWAAYEDSNHSHHQDFFDYFGRIDAFVGWMVDRFRSMKGFKEFQDQIFMISDHGFTGIKSEVYLNRWLQDNGYLKYNQDTPETIMDIGPGSIAFALDPSRIHLNLKDKYPLGTVIGSDYEKIRDEIKEGLELLKFEGDSSIVRKVYYREELYDGPFVGNAPDLVVLSEHGFDLKGRVNSDQVLAKTDLSGMHTQDDAFFYSSTGSPCATIFDAGKIILESLTAS